MHDAYVLRHPPGRLPRTTVSGSEEKSIYNILNMDLFIQKCIDLLQEAFIHPLEPCEACFIMDAHALQKHLPTPILTLGRARIIFNITPIGFV